MIYENLFEITHTTHFLHLFLALHTRDFSQEIALSVFARVNIFSRKSAEHEIDKIRAISTYFFSKTIPTNCCRVWENSPRFNQLFHYFRPLKLNLSFSTGEKVGI